MDNLNQYVRETVGVFDTQAALEQAVSELESTAFPRHDISTQAAPREMKAALGAEAVDAALLEDNPRAPRRAPARPEEKTIGSAALVCVPAYLVGCAAMLLVNPASSWALLGAVAGGSLIGAGLGALAFGLIKAWIDKNAHKQLRKGGLLLWVRTPKPEQEQVAMDILAKHGAKHIHVHSIT